VTPESAPSPVTIVALFALAALAVTFLTGGLLRHIWAQSEQRSIKKMWQARERLLDQPELFAFLRQDFAGEAAEGVIEILMNRRQGVQPRDADGRDPHCNGGVSRDLRELGFAFVRQQAPRLQRTP
jgi:hypothetical protein